MTPGVSDLPARLGIGRFGPAWLAAVGILIVVFAFGVYAYCRQLLEGEIITDMRTIGQGGAAWGLYIVFVIVFIGVSFAGITISAVARLFGIAYLAPIARMAELVTIISLPLGAACILADLGSPLAGLMHLPRYARVMSPFFGTFTLVISGYLFASVVYFYLSGRADADYMARRARSRPLRFYYRLWAFGFQGTPGESTRHADATFWLSLFILPLLITAHSTLGFIFGIQSSRPGWYSALQAPSFVIMAGVSGTGVILVISALVRRLLDIPEVITDKAIKWLGLLLMVLALVYLYFMVVEELTAHYAAPQKEVEVAHHVTSGDFAPWFWTTVAGLAFAVAILFAQYLRGATSMGWHIAAGVLVNIAAVTKRFIIVVPSQTHGTYLAYRHGTYFPSWVEMAVVAGLIALGSLVYLVFLKVFPIVPFQSLERRDKPPPAPADGESRPSHTRRLALFGLTLLLGLAAAIIGFLLSARIGTKPYLDPIVPFSPVLFIFGIIMCFFSSVVYEIVPEMGKTATSPEASGPLSPE